MREKPSNTFLPDIFLGLFFIFLFHINQFHLFIFFLLFFKIFRLFFIFLSPHFSLITNSFYLFFSNQYKNGHYSLINKPHPDPHTLKHYRKDKSCWTTVFAMKSCISCVCKSSSIRHPPFSKIFFSKTAGPVKAKFLWSLSGMGERKFVHGGLGHMTMMATTPIGSL